MKIDKKPLVGVFLLFLMCSMALLGCDLFGRPRPDLEGNSGTGHNLAMVSVSNNTEFVVNVGIDYFKGDNFSSATLPPWHAHTFYAIPAEHTYCVWVEAPSSRRVESDAFSVFFGEFKQFYYNGWPVISQGSPHPSPATVGITNNFGAPIMVNINILDWGQFETASIGIGGTHYFYNIPTSGLGVYFSVANVLSHPFYFFPGEYRAFSYNSWGWGSE